MSQRIDKNYDYSTQLANMRNEYNDTSNRLRQNYQKEVEDLKKVNEQQVKGLQQNYLTNKEKMEGEVAQVSDNYEEQTNKRLDEKQSEYLKNLQARKEEFERINGEIKDRNVRNLDIMRDSFNTAMSEAQKERNRTVKNMQEKASQDLKDNTETYEKRMGELSDRTSKNISRVIENEGKERQRLTEKHDKSMQERDQNFREESSQTRKINDFRTVQMSKNAASEAERMDKKHSEQLIDSKRKNADAVETMQANMKHAQDKILDKEKLAAAKAWQQEEKRQDESTKLLQQLTDARRNADIRVDNEEKKTRAVEFERDRDELRMRGQLEATRNQVSAEVDKNNAVSRRKMTEVQEGWMGRYNRDMLSQRNAARDHESDIRDTFMRDKARTTEIFQSNIHQMKGEHEQNVQTERDIATTKMKNQRDVCGKSVDILNERNNYAQKRMQTKYAKERTDLIEKARKELASQGLDIRDKFHKDKMDINKVWEERLVESKQEYDKLDQQKIESLSRLKDSYLDETKQRTDNEEQNTLIARRAAREQLIEKDLNNAQDIAKMRMQFDMRLEKLGAAHKIEMAKMMKQYEELIRNLTNEKDKELRMRVNDFESKLARQLQLHKLQVETLTSQNEIKIEKMRLAQQLYREKPEEKV